MRLRIPVLVVVILAGACTPSAVEPTLGFGANTPGDLERLATDVFATVTEAMPARSDCLDGAVLVGAWELDDRGRYEPDTAEITIRIPATAGQLEISIVHELAHHLEFSCPQSDETRSAFIAAQGLDPGTDWLDGETWETTPSEQWASAVVLHVLGRPDERARTPIESEALEIVGAWASKP